jgi:hypothetical protein
VLSGEATNINLIVFGLTQPVLEPTIYHTRGEHANHYATNEPTIYHTRGEHANHYATNEPTIYHTRGEHANHYANDAVGYEKKVCTVMVNNSINISKMDNHSSPQTSEHKTLILWI